mmetsp:Transcript_57796/g.164207  ORF Transcript_57796/g.164207 Transcript_57796/m.164207 type:complete len:263 (-) Transcript_57796:3096-3884(-)
MTTACLGAGAVFRGRSPSSPLRRCEEADVAVPPGHVRELLGADVRGGDRELRDVRRGRLRAALEVAAGAEVLVELLEVRDGGRRLAPAACRGARRGLARGRGLAPGCSLAVHGVVHRGLARLRLGRRLLVIRGHKLVSQRHGHAHLQFVLQVRGVLLQERQLVEGHGRVQGLGAEGRGLVALEGGEGAHVLGHGLERGVLHQQLHDLLPLGSRDLVAFHLLLRLERQLALRVPLPERRQHADLPLREAARNVHRGRRRLPTL